MDAATQTTTHATKGPDLSRFPVPLSWLAGLDNCPSPIGLPGALGDRYLCQNNSVYASVRRAALEFGYRFSCEDGVLWRDYQSFGLMTLQRILSMRTIPFLDTGATFARLIEINPRAALSPSLILGGMRPNHTFHEAAHCVAHEVVSRSGFEQVMPAERDHWVTGAIFAESFANTVETLGSLVRNKPLSDAVFYALNSYMRTSDARVGELAACGQIMGAEVRFRLLFLAHYEANLSAPGPVSDVARLRIVEASGHRLPTSAESLSLAENQVIDAGFRLSMGFRENTTPAWFEFLGYGNPYRELAGSSWLSRPANCEFVRELTHRLWEISGRP